MAGKLYICATPIGNLEDITLRAIRILKEVDIIACEDTRVTHKLLNHFDINTKTISYHKFNEKEKASYIIELLKEGNNIALVSDAGTPLISDPGNELISAVRKENIDIIPIPGVSALTATLSATSLESADFTFLGFFPRTEKEKKTAITNFKHTNMVFYESPNRILSTLDYILSNIGDVNVCIAREITKIYEEINELKVTEAIEKYSKQTPKGEIVLVVKKNNDSNNDLNINELVETIEKLKSAGFSNKDVVKILTITTNFSKSDIYQLVISE